MAYGQDDIGRFGSDPVEQWYLSTLQDFNEEQNRTPEEIYNRLLSSGQLEQRSSSLKDVQAPAIELLAGDSLAPQGEDDQPNESSPYDAGAQIDPRLISESIGYMGQPGQIAAGARAFWNYWDGRCASCHGYPPGAMPPPYGGASPFPPNVMPRVGSGAGSSPQPPDKYPQCEMQEQKDRGICAQQPTAQAQAACNKTAFEHRIWCDYHEGELGIPDLFTVRRKSGRRWP